MRGSDSWAIVQIQWIVCLVFFYNTRDLDLNLYLELDNIYWYVYESIIIIIIK